MPSSFFKALLIPILFSVSCSLSTNDPPEDLTANIRSGACLNDINKLFEDYVLKKLDQKQIEHASECISFSLKEFNRVKKNHGFTKQELIDFFNIKIISEGQLSETLVNELMKLKVIFIGGRDDYIHQRDFDGLIELLDFVKDQAIENMAYIKIYRNSLSQREEAVLTRGHLNTAKRQVIRSAEALADRLEKTQGSYEFSSLEVLMREIRKFLDLDDNADGDSMSEQDVDSWLGVLKSYKQIHVSGNENTIESEAWRPLLLSAARYYGATLEYRYFISKGINSGRLADDQTLTSIHSVVSTILNQIITPAMNSNSQKIINFREIELLLTSLQKLGFVFAEPLSEQGGYKPTLDISSMLMPLLRLIDAKLFRAIKSTGIEPFAIRFLSSEFRGWYEANKYFLLLQEEAKKTGVTDLEVVANRLKREGYIDINARASLIFSRLKLKFSNINSNVDPSTMSLFEKIVDNRNYPKHLLTSPYASSTRSFNDLTHLNNLYSVSRLLVLASSEDSSSFTSLDGAHKPTAKLFVEKVLPILKNYGLLDDYDENQAQEFVDQLYMEVGIFTYSGKGHTKDLLLNTTQVTELLGFYLSATEMLVHFDSKFRGKCQNVVPYFNANFNRNFSRLPGLVTAVSKEEDRISYLNMIWEMSKSCSGRQKVNRVDVLTFLVIMHYIESLFVSYDENQSTLLDGKEIMRAYPRVHTVLNDEIVKRLGSSYDKEWGFQKSVYVYLVKNGQVPSGSNWGRLKWTEWRHWFNDDPYQYVKDRSKSAPAMSVDRLGIAKVFKFIYESTLEATTISD